MSSGAGDRAQPRRRSSPTAAVMNAARRIAIPSGGSRSRRARPRRRPLSRPARGGSHDESGSWALRLYRATDLLRRGKDDGGSIALHASWQQHRLASGRPHRARVCLEAQVELPERNDLAVLGRDVIAVAAVAGRPPPPLPGPPPWGG